MTLFCPRRLMWLLYKSKSHRSTSSIFTSRGIFDIESLSKYKFWKEKYSEKGQHLSFDWFVDSQKIYPFVYDHIKDYALNYHGEEPFVYIDLGCGLSTLSSIVYQESSTPLKVIFADFILDALEHQRNFCKSIQPKNKRSSIHFLCADVLELPLKNNFVDIAIDKGTMDALIKDQQSGQIKAAKMMSELWRILAPGGLFIQITDEDPDSRLLSLEKFCKEENHVLNSLKHLGNSNDKNESGIPNNNNDKCNNSSSNKNSTGQNFQKGFTSWSFKIFNDENSGKEYFMYYTKKHLP